MTATVVTVSLAVTAAGLLTSVGHDARTACAAIRAGIRRPAPIAEARVLDLGSATAVPLTGHPVTPFTDGFVGTARWLQLAPRALANLAAVGSLPPPGDAAFWRRCALVVALPDLESDRFLFDERAYPSVIAQTFLEPLVRQLPPALPPAHVLLRPHDRMTLPRVIQQSSELMASMGVDRIVVLAVDSLVDAFALHWLGEAGRLKSDLNPVGLMPGECGAALLLEADRRGVHDERPAWAVVTTAATGSDAAFDDPEAPPRGRALAQVLAPAIQGGVVDVFSDLNGEAWRAREYGTALVHLGAAALEEHHAAGEVGDVGAASPVLHTVLAARSLQRGYARGDRVAVSISSDDGGVGALGLRRA